MLYEFELSHNIMEGSNTFCVKGEGTVDNRTIT